MVGHEDNRRELEESDCSCIKVMLEKILIQDRILDGSIYTDREALTPIETQILHVD